MNANYSLFASTESKGSWRVRKVWEGGRASHLMFSQGENDCSFGTFLSDNSC